MSFLAPLLLLGAVTLAVPLLVHLFRRKERTLRIFPAVRYLKETDRDSSRLVRLRQLLLLACRLGVLACLVLAGARLVLPLGGSDHPPAGLAIVVDNGITSARVVGDRRVLDILVDRARAALARTGPSDRIWIVAAGQPWRPALPENREAAAEALSALEPTAVRPDLPSAVARARTLLEAGAPPLRQILLLSPLDLPLEPPAEVTAGSEEAAGDLPLAVWSPELTLPPNRGIREIRTDGGLPPRAGRPVEVEIRVGGTTTPEESARLRLDGSLVAAGRTDDQGWARIRLPPQDPGWLSGSVELDPDALRLDDERHFAVFVRHSPRVRWEAPLPPHLETALELLADRERIEPVADESAVGVEADGNPITGRRPTLVFAPSDPARLPAVNRRLAELGAGWRLEAREAETSSPGPGKPSSEQGFLRVEEATPTLRLGTGIVVRHRYLLQRTEPASADSNPSTVHARLSDGSPWVGYEAPGPEGSSDGVPVVVVASPPVPEASDLPTSARMIPFLSAALEILDGGPMPRETPAGDPLSLSAEAAVVRGPEGTQTPVRGLDSFSETGQPGFYDELAEGGELLGRFAVNPAEVPDGNERIPASEAAQRLGQRGSGFDDPAALDRALLAGRRGREAWRPLALAAFLLLLAEGWLASFGRRESSPGREPRRAPQGRLDSQLESS